MLGDRLKKLRAASNLSQKQLADAVGVDRKTISFWETDKASPNSDNIIALAKVLKVTVEQLSGAAIAHVYNGIRPEKSIPIYGYAHCGYLNLAEPEIEGHVPACDIANAEAHFALIAHGGSMEPFIMAGDVLIFRRVEGIKLDRVKERPVSPDRMIAYEGRICCVMIDNETSVKRWHVATGPHWTLELLPVNPHCESITLGPDQEMELQGVLVELRRKC